LATDSGSPWFLCHYSLKALTEIRKNSFALRIVKTWNCLPDSVITAPTTNTFKNRLDKYWANQDILYDAHRTTITGMGNEIEVETDTEEPQDPESVAEPISLSYCLVPLFLMSCPSTV
jgi:hypothetical protein